MSIRAVMAPFGESGPRLLAFHAPEANDWLTVDQFTGTENRNTRRPYIVLFLC